MASYTNRENERSFLNVARNNGRSHKKPDREIMRFW